MNEDSSLLTRAKQSRAARVVGAVRRARRERHLPLLSVVVPVHNSAEFLPDCVESLLAQPGRVQVVLVDDGSTDTTPAVAKALAARHHNVTLVSQAHAGVGKARNLGVEHAQGQYLAFCDADDTVPPRGYTRLVEALEGTGSDLAVGAAAIEEKGRFLHPEWARRSNSRRRLCVHLTETPELLGNLVVGARVFRRSFWDGQGLEFESVDERSDARLLVRALLVSSRLDVVPAIVYRWGWRDDNRSLHQRDLYDAGRVADRVRAIQMAGELLIDAPEALRQTYYSEVLHTTVPGLVKAAVCRDDGYWEALHGELTTLLDLIPTATTQRVPVSDRITAWLCAENQRDASEDYLEYAFDNQHGFPFDLSEGRPRIALPFIDALAGAPRELTLVADADMRFRARLTRTRWLDERTLLLEGAAFMEYLDDRCGESAIELVLTEQSTGREVRFPARQCEEVAVNQWCGRANEDHTGAGFAVEIDVSGLEVTGPAAYDVSVDLRLAGFHRSGPFRSRNGAASPGLLEASLLDGSSYLPVWHEHRGLSLQVSAAEAELRPRHEPVEGDTVTVRSGVLVIEGDAEQDLWISLVGPRATTARVRADREGSRFRAEVSLLVDEWGLGPSSLPADTYEVQAHTATGVERTVACARSLWRALPHRLVSDEWSITPTVLTGGRLAVRVVPREWIDSRPPFLRRGMRDRLYAESRAKPLLDVVLFETFAGKGTGDNPGAICAELAGRGLALDLVCSVMDRSHVVPPGVRIVIRWSPEWFELIGRARYLVVNASLPYFFRKREGQLYYQTWHGTPLKRIAHDRPHLDFFNWHHRRQLLVARDGWDFLLSQSEACTKFLRSAFRYSGPVMEVGYPRNDILVSERGRDVRARVRAHFDIPEDANVVLYAPTWRDNARVGRVFTKVLYLDPHEVVSSIPNSYLLVRGHYNSVGAAEDRTGSERVLDVTRYPDIADLYLAADVLVTDYSSVFFDFALTDKPMVFLAPDLEAYRDDNRGFYLDYHDTVPGPICITTREVVEAINGPDRYAGTRKQFRERFTPLDDGEASARVVDAILRAHPLLDRASSLSDE